VARLLGRAPVRLVGRPLPLSPATLITPTTLVAPVAPAVATLVAALITPAAAPLALVAPAAAAATTAAATAATAPTASLLVLLPEVCVDCALHKHGNAWQPVAKVVLVGDEPPAKLANGSGRGERAVDLEGALVIEVRLKPAQARAGRVRVATAVCAAAGGGRRRRTAAGGGRRRAGGGGRRRAAAAAVGGGGSGRRQVVAGGRLWRAAGCGGRRGVGGACLRWPRVRQCGRRRRADMLHSFLKLLTTHYLLLPLTSSRAP